MNAPGLEFSVTNYDKAKAAVDLCHRVDDVVDIKKLSEMAELYARQAGDTQMERQAMDIRIRAERKCGELLAQLERDPASRGGDQKSASSRATPISEYAATLERTGMSRQTANRYQQLAKVPQAEFEAGLLGDDRPSSRAILDRTATAKDVTPAAYSERGLFLWGRLRDFEQMGILAAPINELLSEMTESMRADVSRLLVALRDWMEE